MGWITECVCGSHPPVRTISYEKPKELALDMLVIVKTTEAGRKYRHEMSKRVSDAMFSLKAMVLIKDGHEIDPSDAFLWSSLLSNASTSGSTQREYRITEPTSL